MTTKDTNLLHKPPQTLRELNEALAQPGTRRIRKGNSPMTPPPPTPQPPSPELEVDSEMRKALLALIEKLITQNKALREALEALVSYTEACEGLLNASPAGQVIAARQALAATVGKEDV